MVDERGRYVDESAVVEASAEVAAHSFVDANATSAPTSRSDRRP